MYTEMITLIQFTASGEYDANGDEIMNVSERDVMAKLKSIGQSEFYQAATSGYKPELKFELADYLEYKNEPLVRWMGMQYKILRTFRTVTNAIELTVYGGVRNADT